MGGPGMEEASCHIFGSHLFLKSSGKPLKSWMIFWLALALFLWLYTGKTLRKNSTTWGTSGVLFKVQTFLKEPVPTYRAWVLSLAKFCGNCLWVNNWRSVRSQLPKQTGCPSKAAWVPRYRPWEGEPNSFFTDFPF